MIGQGSTKPSTFHLKSIQRSIDPETRVLHSSSLSERTMFCSCLGRKQGEKKSSDKSQNDNNNNNNNENSNSPSPNIPGPSPSDIEDGGTKYTKIPNIPPLEHQSTTGWYNYCIIGWDKSIFFMNVESKQPTNQYYTCPRMLLPISRRSTRIPSTRTTIRVCITIVIELVNVIVIVWSFPYLWVGEREGT